MQGRKRETDSGERERRKKKISSTESLNFDFLANVFNFFRN